MTTDWPKCSQRSGAIKEMVNRVRLRGATVARLTPDQKVACSNHVGVRYFFRSNVSIRNGMFILNFNTQIVQYDITRALVRRRTTYG